MDRSGNNGASSPLNHPPSTRVARIISLHRSITASSRLRLLRTPATAQKGLLANAAVGSVQTLRRYRPERVESRDEPPMRPRAPPCIWNKEVHLEVATSRDRRCLALSRSFPPLLASSHRLGHPAAGP